MIDSLSLFIALLAISIWAVTKYLLTPRIFKSDRTDPTLQKQGWGREKRKYFFTRIGVVTSLMLIWVIAIVLLTGGISHENNRNLLEVVLFSIGILWAIGIYTLRK